MIVKVLDKVSEIIANRKAELEKLDELIKARFVEMFGDPVSNPKGLLERTLPELGEFGNIDLEMMRLYLVEFIH